MKIHVAFGGGAEPHAAVKLAVRAEEAGAEGFWVTEGAAGDAFGLLAAASQVTSRISLGTAVVSVFVRSVPLLAMSALTLADLSEGRFILGIGPSHREQTEREHGLAFVRPVGRLTDAVAVIREVADQGSLAPRRFSNGAELGGFEFRMGDAAPRRIPLVIGATGPKMIKRATEVADGILLVWRTPEEIAELRREIPPDRTLLLLAHCAVGDRESDCEQQLELAREKHSRFERYRAHFDQKGRRGGLTLPDGVDLAERLRPYAEAGLDGIVLLPLNAGIPVEAEFEKIFDQLHETAEALG